MYYNAEQNASLYVHVNDSVQAIKSKYDDPYIFVGGDFNRKNFRQALLDQPAIKKADIGPTRDQAPLDIIGFKL